MDLRLDGKKVLITGASRGIGKAIAELCLSSGAEVGIHFGKSEEAAQAIADHFPQSAQVFKADLSISADWNTLLESFLAHFGTLDVLINNAGVALLSPLEAEDARWLAEWEKTLAVNLSASSYLARQAVQHFLAQKKEGRIINIASRAAFRGDTSEYLAYAASKGGMVAFSHSIARAYGKQGIKSFVLAPGFTLTDMAQDFIDAYGEAHALGDIVLPQLTRPEDIAPMVLLLASGKADHATGSTVTMNAGSYIR
ncbi:MAG: SDR family oxidoreductase [Bacteroidota bacterium]